MRCVNSRHYWSEMCCLAGVSLALHYLHQRGFRAGGFFPLGKAVDFSNPMGADASLHMVTPANHHSVSRWGWGWNCRGIIVQVIVAPSQSQSFYDLCDPVMLRSATLRLLLRLLLMLLLLLLQSMSLLLLPLLLLLLLWLSWFSGNLNAVYSWSLWFDKNPWGTIFNSVLIGFQKLHSPFRCQKRCTL